MKSETFYKYRIFDITLGSNVKIPYLDVSNSNSIHLFFSLRSHPVSLSKEINWAHSWWNQDNVACMHLAKQDDNYILNFPDTADFIFRPNRANLVAYIRKDSLASLALRLLVDQVIPRVICELGNPVIHASGSLINNYAILFSGKTGLGKSTLSAFFQSKGFPSFCDDSLLLEMNNQHLTGTASYLGNKLNQDSLEYLKLKQESMYRIIYPDSFCAKKRIKFRNNTDRIVIKPPIKAIFFLNTPSANPLFKSKFAISRLSGNAALVNLTENMFHLDPTNYINVGEILRRTSEYLSTSNIPIFNLIYERDFDVLPFLYHEIIDLTKRIETS